MKKILLIIKKRKITFVVILLVLITGGYFGYKAIVPNKAIASYVEATAQEGAIIVSVSGSGQVLSLNEVDIKPEASGELIYLGVANGKAVQKGALIATIDKTDLLEDISDAQTSLEQAQLALSKMNGLTTQQGTLRGTKEKLQDNLNKSYDNGLNDVADVFLNLPNIMSGLSDVLFSYNFTTGQWNIDYYNDVIRAYDYEADIYRTDAFDKYQIARKAYDKNFQDYKLTSRNSSQEETEALIEQTYQTVKDISQAIKSANNLIQFYQDKVIGANKTPQTLSSTHLSSLSGYTSKTNSYLSTLLSDSDSIKSNKESLVEADFDIKDQEIKVAQAEKNLKDLQAKLVDYSVYAPFAGIISQVNVKKGDDVSSATVLATIITKQKIAEISLNEVDASNVKVGQKVILTFDAIDNLTITGAVVEVDSVGTVSQGVVSYNVKVSLEGQDESIKTGMSVSANIITEVKQDVLMVPNSAIKNQDDFYYVQVIEATSSVPLNKEVVIGIANDEYTEIVSGISIGDVVITKTIESTQKPANQTATGNILNVGGSSSNRNVGPMMMGR